MIKKIVGFLLLIGFISLGSKSISPNEPNLSINFSEKIMAEVLLDAEESDKLVFVDVSTSWCGYCKKMKANTYTDESVIKLINDKYISKSIDAEKGEGIAIAKKYSVSAYPTVLVLNAKGDLLKTGEGYMRSSDLIQFLEN